MVDSYGSLKLNKEIKVLISLMDYSYINCLTHMERLRLYSELCNLKIISITEFSL